MPSSSIEWWSTRKPVVARTRSSLNPSVSSSTSTLRPQSVENKGRMARGLKEKVWPLLETGKVKPIIYKTFPLREAVAAHAELERADHVGKVMLTV